MKEKAWVKEMGKRKGWETWCSPWVVWSRSCPINTGEQLNRPGPPSWLTAESSHWPPALCYMTWGVQLNWQKETACTSQTVGGRGPGEKHTHNTRTHLCTHGCFKAASTLRGHKVANTKISTHSHAHTHPDRRKDMPFPFTGEQKRETPRCFSYLVGESEEL